LKLIRILTALAINNYRYKFKLYKQNIRNRLVSCRKSCRIRYNLRGKRVCLTQKVPVLMIIFRVISLSEIVLI
jgi:hypothetical protein